jgi:tetratricopeptide (TPR) repeat protein
MKTTDSYEQQSHPKVGKRFWQAKLGALPAIGILLIAIPVGLHWFPGSFGEQQLDPIYRYRYQRPEPGSVTVALNREMAFYQERIGNSPDDGLNRALLATTYIRMAKATGESSWYLLAQQTAEESLANLPFDNDGAIMALARVATAKHDFAEAVRLAKKAQPTDEVLSVLVTANLAMGKVEEARIAADKLVKQTPSAAALTLQALVKVALGKDGEAIEDFKGAIAAEEAEETGSSVWARTSIGRLYFKRGKLKLAEQLYREALRILPQYAPAILNLAELQIRLGHYREAERLYEKFFLTSQRSPDVYDHVIMRGMARVKELQGDKERAKEWRDKAEARLREDLTGFGHGRELARLLLERGSQKDISEALSLMQGELRVRRDAETLDTQALALQKAGRWREAQQAMREALRWGIRDPALFYRAGTIEKALGNDSQAIAFFRLARETDPTFDEKAQRALGLGVGLLGLS